MPEDPLRTRGAPDDGPGRIEVVDEDSHDALLFGFLVQLLERDARALTSDIRSEILATGILPDDEAGDDLARAVAAQLLDNVLGELRTGPSSMSCGCLWKLCEIVPRMDLEAQRELVSRIASVEQLLAAERWAPPGSYTEVLARACVQFLILSRNLSRNEHAAGAADPPNVDSQHRIFTAVALTCADRIRRQLLTTSRLMLLEQELLPYAAPSDAVRPWGALTECFDRFRARTIFLLSLLAYRDPIEARIAEVLHDVPTTAADLPLPLELARRIERTVARLAETPTQRAHDAPVPVEQRGMTVHPGGVRTFLTEAGPIPEHQRSEGASQGARARVIHSGYDTGWSLRAFEVEHEVDPAWEMPHLATRTEYELSVGAHVFRSMGDRPPPDPNELLRPFCAVFLDVGGTVQDREHGPDAAAVLRTVSELCCSGVPVALATGRTLARVQARLQEVVPLPFPGLSLFCENGMANARQRADGSWEELDPVRLRSDVATPERVSRYEQTLEQLRALLATGDPAVRVFLEAVNPHPVSLTISVTSRLRVVPLPRRISRQALTSLAMLLVSTIDRDALDGFDLRVGHTGLQIIPNILGKEASLAAFTARLGLPHGAPVLRIGDSAATTHVYHESVHFVFLSGADHEVLDSDDGFLVSDPGACANAFFSRGWVAPLDGPAGTDLILRSVSYAPCASDEGVGGDG